MTIFDIKLMLDKLTKNRQKNYYFSKEFKRKKRDLITFVLF